MIRMLGRGGMAFVYLALQESIDREVAIKVMLPQLAADPSFSERFLREARTLAKLSHPNIVAVYDVGISAQYHYIAMEFHSGGELKDRIKKGDMTVADVISVTKQIATALNFAHSKGYVHRDIKPENVLFKEDGTPVLSDFGIARATDSSTRMTATGSVIGTPHYMSPEQAQGRDLDGRSDLYSVGIMFFEMLTGVVPYKGDSALSIGIKHLRDPIPRLPAQYRPYQTFLDKLLAKEPDDRWQTGADVVRTLEILEMQAGGGEGAVTGQVAALHDADTTAPMTQINGGATQPMTASTQVMGTRPVTRATARQTAQTAVSQQKKGGMGAILLAATLLAGGGGGYYWYMQQKPDNTLPPTATPAPQAKIRTAPPVKTDNGARITELMAEAVRAIREKRFIEPKGNNAFEAYQQVLRLEPGNDDARNGLRQMAGRFLEDARRSAKTGKIERAREQLDTGVLIDSKHPDIDSTRTTIASAEEALRASQEKQRANRREQEQQQRKLAAEKERQRQQALRAEQQRLTAEKNRLEKEKQLRTLLAEAEELLSPYSLTQERINRARGVFDKASRMAPGDARTDGRNRIADAYVKLATNMADAKKYDEAEAVIKAGLSFTPNNSRLADLKSYIEKQKAPKRRTFGGF